MVGIVAAIGVSAAADHHAWLGIEMEDGRVTGGGPLRTCGQGPVEITITRSTPCPRDPTCRLQPRFDGTYGEICVQTSMGCAMEWQERWTDWPECGGEKVVQ